MLYQESKPSRKHRNCTNWFTYWPLAYNLHVGQKKNAIKIRMAGELGNQLFQLVAGLLIVKKIESKLELEFSSLSSNRLQPYSFYDPKLITISENGLNRYAKYVFDYIPIFKYVKKLLLKFMNVTTFTEKFAHVYDNRILRIKDKSVISGYFQSFRYVKECESYYPVREMLGLKTFSNEYHDLKHELEAYPFVAVHIRRGNQQDPSSILSSEIHGLLPPDYYDNAYNLLSKLIHIEEYKIIVFTDNKSESAEFVKDFGFLVDRIIGRDDLQSQQETMHLISKSQHIIGANSSFSWWAAYLGDNENTFTIFPKPWYKKPGETDQQILWPHWLVCGFESYL
jgi:hypothetical protein